MAASGDSLSVMVSMTRGGVSSKRMSTTVRDMERDFATMFGCTGSMDTGIRSDRTMVSGAAVTLVRRVRGLKFGTKSGARLRDRCGLCDTLGLSLCVSKMRGSTFIRTLRGTGTIVRSNSTVRTSIMTTSRGLLSTTRMLIGGKSGASLRGLMSSATSCGGRGCLDTK